VKLQWQASVLLLGHGILAPLDSLRNALPEHILLRQQSQASATNARTELSHQGICSQSMATAISSACPSSFRWIPFAETSARRHVEANLQ
jgi:hypothetical protein